MIKIGFLPLDSRPCNYEWIKDFAKLTNTECITLPIVVLGNLHQTLSWTKTKTFLLDIATKVDYLLIAIDSYMHGGLIQSRTVKLSHEEAKERLDFLYEIKKLNPKLKIFAFDTVLRTSISTIDEESKKNWELVSQYCKYLGRYYRYHDEADLTKSKELEAMIPSHVLEYFLSSRSIKNHITLWGLELVANQVLDLLLLLQEDSMPDGIQSLEHVTIRKYIDEHQLNNKAYLYNGTDEGMSVLFARCFVEETKKQVNYYLLCPDHSYLDKPQPFEDRPYIQNLEAMTSILNLKETPTLENADIVLAINVNETPLSIEQSERPIPQTFAKDEKSLNFINQINTLLNQNYQVFLLDIAIPNGGIWEMMHQIEYLKLKGYSAWNTASNSTGSLLAHAYLYATTPQSDTKQMTNDLILYRSIIDDCIYQDIVRASLNDFAQIQNINIYNFGDNITLNKMLNEELHKITNIVIPIKYRAYFPWNRTFEIGIRFIEE